MVIKSKEYYLDILSEKMNNNSEYSSLHKPEEDKYCKYMKEAKNLEEARFRDYPYHLEYIITCENFTMPKLHSRQFFNEYYDNIFEFI